MNDRPGPDGDLRRTVQICNRKGLHARAAFKFVRCVEMFNAEVAVSREGNTVSGLSIMGLMMLAAAPGAEIEIAARGREAAEALAAVCALIEGGFDETD